MSDITGGLSPNPNGSPIQPGTTFTGPLIAGNVLHSDGSGNLAGLGGSTGTANAGYAQMAQSAVINSTALTATTTIVIPAQSQITDIYVMVTTVQAGGTFGMGTTANPTALSTAAAGSTATLGQLNTTLIPTTSVQIANWDNTGNQDIQVIVTFNATGAFVGTLTVFYIPGINLAS